MDIVAKSPETACINCGRCVDVCPSRIIPSRLADYAQRHDEEAFVAMNGLECVECGSCSYVCPAKRPLKQAIAPCARLRSQTRGKSKRGERELNEKLHVSSSPHIRDKVKSSNIMLMVIIGLLPATLFGIWNFRHENAWILVVVTTAAAVLSEYIWEKLMHKPITVSDCSAAVTGLLLALNLPPTLPWWMGVVGAVFAIIVVKQLFGGLGTDRTS